MKSEEIVLHWIRQNNFAAKQWQQRRTGQGRSQQFCCGGGPALSGSEQVLYTAPCFYHFRTHMNLEQIVGRKPPQLKSEGESKIARFLDENSIKYFYEPGVLVYYPRDKARIWYPDFYLPEFTTYIEYFGLSGKQQYDQGIKTKEAIYSKMGLSIIPIFPWTFTENWEGYIMNELKRKTVDSYKNLMSKPYWRQVRSCREPGLSRTRTTQYSGPRN